jgi:SlyX protein
MGNLSTEKLGIMNMEERLIELETRFSFQEDTIETLGNILTDQQTQIDALKRQIESVTTMLQELAEPEDENKED